MRMNGNDDNEQKYEEEEEDENGKTYYRIGIARFFWQFG